MFGPASKLQLASLTLLLALLLAPVEALTQQGLSVRPAANQSNAAQSSVPWAQSAWTRGYNSSTRLLAGATDGTPSGRKLLAGIEIRMSEGWKTYWRHPGDDGGMPPSFDWAGSSNLKSARVLYPVPERLKSVGGASIGYAKAVTFPVEMEAVDPAQPVELVLVLEYGICREICVPAEAKLQLQVSPTLAAMPPELAAAIGRVPRAAEPTGANGQPSLKAASVVLSGTAPGLAFDIATASMGPLVDLFVEAPDGLYLPMTVKSGPTSAGIQRFRIDLKGVEDIAKLAGKTLRLTIAGPNGGTEANWLVR